MSDDILRSVTQGQLNSTIPMVSVGDTVDVHVKIVEGAKERIQVFTGVVIKRQGSGINETITVRRIVANEGVERTFPIHSPRIAGIKVQRHGHVRRSKLYYLRERVGKKRRLRDRRRGLGWLVQQEEQQSQEAAEREAKEKAAAEASGSEG
ncbi:MAG: 50S ribosomal protein L19 [Phycisphaeraceae bacterium]|nr:50S ribosomal protein L19 [Phycisphaeraceae bacterium]